MTTAYDTIKNYLEKYPKARERRNRNDFICWILWDEYRVDRGLSKQQLQNLIISAETYGRMWRQVTLENKHLRGGDYDTKEKVEQEKQIALGYEVGYNKDIKNNQYKD